jgi:hypothetical protein
MDRTCSVGGCEREAYSRGFCEMHYRRVLRTGSPGPTGTVRQRSICSAPNCEEVVDAKGLCHGHYQRLSRTGRRDVSLELWTRSQPSGRRVEELLEWCQIMFDRYYEEAWDFGSTW